MAVSELGIRLNIPARYIQSNRRVFRPTGEVLYTLVRQVTAGNNTIKAPKDYVLLVKPTGGVAEVHKDQPLRVEYETVSAAIKDLKRIDKLRAKELE